MRNDNQEVKKSGKFASALKRIFVHNFGWKLLALVSSAIFWALTAGLM